MGKKQASNRQNQGQQTTALTFNDKRKAFQQTLDQMSGEFSKVCLPTGMQASELKRLAVNACYQNPDLLECTQASIVMSLMLAAALGLRPDGRHAHLVPYFDKKIGAKICQLIPDYKGLVALAVSSPHVVAVDAACVCENDKFDYQLGSDQYLHHKPAMKDRGEPIGAWAGARLPGGGFSFVVMNGDEIRKRRDKAKTRVIWDAWPQEMWMKTAVLALSKTTPLGGACERATIAANAADSADGQTPALLGQFVADAPGALPGIAEPGPPSRTDRLAQQAAEARSGAHDPSYDGGKPGNSASGQQRDMTGPGDGGPDNYDTLLADAKDIGTPEQWNQVDARCLAAVEAGAVDAEQAVALQEILQDRAMKLGSGTQLDSTAAGR